MQKFGECASVEKARESLLHALYDSDSLTDVQRATSTSELIGLGTGRHQVSSCIHGWMMNLCGCSAFTSTACTFLEFSTSKIARYLLVRCFGPAGDEQFISNVCLHFFMTFHVLAYLTYIFVILFNFHHAMRLLKCGVML